MTELLSLDSVKKLRNIVLALIGALILTGCTQAEWFSFYHSSISGAIAGGLIGAFSTSILGLIIFYKQLNKDRSFRQIQKLENIILITNKLLHRLNIILKSKQGFFSEPEKYYQREHPEGEYFENPDDYYEYMENTNGLIFENIFYEDFEALKAYICMFQPDFSEKIIQIENKILEVNPMLHVARDVDSDYFTDLKKHIESINDDLHQINKEMLAEIHKKFTRKL